MLVSIAGVGVSLYKQGCMVSGLGHMWSIMARWNINS
jgi:hypothetical protein